MKTKTISNSNWKSHLLHSRLCLIIFRQLNHKTDQTKLITGKLWIPMNPYMVLIGTFKRRSHTSLDATPVWATWLSIWWVKQKGCLEVQMTKILVFLITMPCNWWHKRKLVSGWKKKDTNKYGSYMKRIYSPANPHSNTTEVVHLGIARNFAILIPI